MYKLVCTRGVVNFCCSPSFLLILLSFIPCFIFHYPNIVISTVFYDFVLILFCLGSLSPRFFSFTIVVLLSCFPSRFAYYALFHYMSLSLLSSGPLSNHRIRLFSFLLPVFNVFCLFIFPFFP